MGTTVVLGASNKPERYSNQAVRLLMEHGHRVIPVNPAQKVIEGLAVSARLEDIAEPVETISVYLNPAASEVLSEAMLALHPVRVIFNPGSESEVLERRLQEAGIQTERACTLVLLRTGQYDLPAPGAPDGRIRV